MVSEEQQHSSDENNAFVAAPIYHKLGRFDWCSLIADSFLGRCLMSSDWWTRIILSGRFGSWPAGSTCLVFLLRSALLRGRQVGLRTILGS